MECADKESTSKDMIRESLGLLDSTADNFAEFAIDSDDEIDMNINTDIPLNSPPANLDPALDPKQADNKAESNFSRTQLEKVITNEDPLTVLVNATDKSGAATVLKNNHTGTTENATTTSKYQATSATYSSVSAPVSTVHDQFNSSSQSVTQSLSSTFSSFASKFQDAVSSAGTSSSLATEATAIPIATQSTPDDETIRVVVNKNANSSGYVERSAENNGSSISSSNNNINMLQHSLSYTSVNSNAPSVYSSYAQSSSETKTQPIYQIGNTGVDINNSLKS